MERTDANGAARARVGAHRRNYHMKTIRASAWADDGLAPSSLGADKEQQQQQQR